MKNKKIDNQVVYYDYIDQGSDKLVVLFQAMGQASKVSNQKEYSTLTDDEWKIKLIKTHSSYTYYKFFVDKDINILVLPDMYSNCIGWYTFDNGQRVDKKIAQFIDEFIVEKNYDKTKCYLFGSSKGAYGSLVVGANCDIDNIIMAYPIIYPGSRYKEYISNPMFQFQIDRMRGDMDWEQLCEEFNKILDNALPSLREKKIISLLGISDEYSDVAMQLFNNQNNKFYINTKITNHATYAKEVIEYLVYIFEAEVGLSNER